MRFENIQKQEGVWLLAVAIVALMAASCSHDAQIPKSPILTYERDVRPIISNSCARVGCHNGSGESPSLTSYAEVMGNITPGEPAKSKLYRVMTKLGGGSAMPPEGPLPDDQIKTMYIWILQGAKEK